VRAPLVLAVIALASAGAAPPRPLVSMRGTLWGVAQDGGRIAWTSGGCYAVHIRSLASNRQARIGDARPVECGPVDTPDLALAGRRALWTLTQAGNNVYTEVMTGRAGTRPRRLEEVIGASAGSDGDYVTDVAGDAPTLVYSVITMSFLDTCIDPGEPCDYFVDGGRVRRVVGRSTRRVPGLPPALNLAASGRRIALVVAAHETPDGYPRPSGAVEVRDAVSGAALSRVTVAGAPSQVALGATYEVVLARTASGERLLRYRWSDGALLGSTAVPRNATNLGIAGRRIVLSSGRAIRLVDAATGAVRTVARARSNPIGVSIEGRRLVWGERLGRRSRIVAVAVD
jgi:hypothetical protein